MSFFSDFFGSTQQGDLKDAEAQRAAALAAGKKRARGDITGGYSEAQGFLNPYMDNGAGQNLYEDSIGANGTEGYGRALTNFEADPFRQGEQASADNALMSIFKKYNAGGQGNSGASRLAVSRGAQERYGGQVSDYRNRLMGLGQQGLGVAQASAGLSTDRGNTLGNLEYGYGQQSANAATNYGNAMASSRSIGPNNLLGLLGTATKAASLFV